MIVSSGSGTSSSSFIGIWEGTSQSMIRDTEKYEKPGTPFIRIEDLQAIARIVQPILDRLQQAGAGYGSAPTSVTACMSAGGLAAISQSGSSNFT